MIETNVEPKWELAAATFPSQEKAAAWAYHVARTSQRKCRVRLIGDRWRVERIAATKASSE